MPAWLYFLTYTLLDGARQGIITWLFREYVPAKRLDWINAALHFGGVLSYALLISLFASHPGRIWLWAVLIRWLLFDLVLTLTWNYVNYREHRPWESLFSVGTSALTDRLTRWVAERLGLSPPVVRAASWALAVGLTITAASSL